MQRRRNDLVSAKKIFLGCNECEGFFTFLHMLNVILFFHFAEGSSVWDKKETGWNIQSWVGQKSEGDYDEEFAKINFKKKAYIKKKWYMILKRACQMFWF